LPTSTSVAMDGILRPPSAYYSLWSLPPRRCRGVIRVFFPFFLFIYIHLVLSIDDGPGPVAFQFPPTNHGLFAFNSLHAPLTCPGLRGSGHTARIRALLADRLLHGIGGGMPAYVRAIPCSVRSLLAADHAVAQHKGRKECTAG